MTDIQKEEQSLSPKEISPRDEFRLENPEPTKEQREQQELSREEIQRLRTEIDQTDFHDETVTHTQNHVQDIQATDDDGKVQKLLSLAKTKGILYAIHVAKKIGDPYILDTLHDQLVAQGYYHEFKHRQSR